jgi:predicted house-cleaning noncanonical NTP pyrophosphatase (MazG superfamily)
LSITYGNGQNVPLFVLTIGKRIFSNDDEYWQKSRFYVWIKYLGCGQMKITKYNKLVRDRIPEIIEKSGKKAIVQKLDDEAYKKFLDEKLGEELQEYLDSDSVDELADLVEVIHSILKYKRIEITGFYGIQKKKAEERGAFEKRLLLKEVIEK